MRSRFFHTLLDILAVVIILAIGLVVIRLMMTPARAQTTCVPIDRFGYLCIDLPRDAWVQHAHQKLAQNQWIDRAYNKKNERCCDAGKDCHTVEPERVKPAPGGVTVDGSIFIPGEQIMVSRDGHHWLCYWGGQVKCFFAPWSGS